MNREEIFNINDTDIIEKFFASVCVGINNCAHCKQGRMDSYAFYCCGALWELRILEGINEFIISQMNIARQSEINNAVMFFADTIYGILDDNLDAKLSRNKRGNGTEDIFVSIYEK